MCWPERWKTKRGGAIKKRICGILVATQLMGVWLAAAQTNTHPTTKQQSYAIQVSPRPVAAAGTGRANPAIAVFPRTLNFAPVGLGKSRNLTFTVQNVGTGILTGEAKVSAPFSVIGGSPYVLGSSQSQVITVQYLPKAAGMNVSVVVLTGAGAASVTVAGSAFPARPAAPAPPKNLRMLAGR
jgi:hypothetical protein